MPTIALERWNHVGIRVSDRARALAFYRLFGFEEIGWHPGPKVSILRSPAGLELNLIVNGVAGPNVLMDVPEKRTGYTHASFWIASLDDAIAALGAAGVTITEGPIELAGEIAIFVRDPDGNVVELAVPNL